MKSEGSIDLSATNLVAKKKEEEEEGRKTKDDSVKISKSSKAS